MDPQMQYVMDTRHLRHSQLMAKADTARAVREAGAVGDDPVATPQRSWLERLITSLGANYGAQEPYWMIYGAENG